MHGYDSFCASLANSPATALPTGSWRARGRRADGVHGGFPGFGMSMSHESRQLGGIHGSAVLHQCCSSLYNGAVRASAWAFHMRPGVKGLATALVAGMARSAQLRSASEKGISNEACSGMGTWAGPAQVLDTYSVRMDSSSTGEAMLPDSFRSCMRLRGCLGEN